MGTHGQSNNAPEHDALDAYLDGMTSASELRELETRIGRDESLCAAIALQGRIDGALADVYDAPSPDRILEHIASGASRGLQSSRTSAMGQSHVPLRQTARWMSVGRGLALAAVVAIAFVGIWRIVDFYREGDDTTPLAGSIPDWNPNVSFVDAYRAVEAADFAPSWICDSDEQFIDTFRKLFRQPLSLAQSPDDIAVLGLGYANTISGGTVTMLARVRGEGAMVFIDRVNYDADFTLPADSGMHLFRREIGRAVLYELTPFDKPELLDLFQDPDAG